MEAKAWQEFLGSIVPGGIHPQDLAKQLAAAGLTLVGKNCSYRPLYERESKTATIIECRQVVWLSGKVSTLVVLDTGEEVDVMSVYFPLLPASTA